MIEVCENSCSLKITGGRIAAARKESNVKKGCLVSTNAWSFPTRRKARAIFRIAYIFVL
jgi:hypothetical protein